MTVPEYTSSDKQAGRDKSSLRQALRSRRLQQARLRRVMAARSLRDTLAAMPAFRRARHIAAYWPVAGEMDLRPLIRLAWQLGKQVYLPRVRPARELEFTLLRPGTRPLAGPAVTPAQARRAGAFGIPVTPGWPIRRRTGELDLVLAPVVGFDKQGYRLGMGGGYYDRLLASPTRPTVIGVAYAFQEIKRADRTDVSRTGVSPTDIPRAGAPRAGESRTGVPREAWDMPVDLVVTERQVIDCWPLRLRRRGRTRKTR